MREFRIPADLRRLGEARRFAEEMAATAGFDTAQRHEIKLAASEAIANAIEHGSRSMQDEVVVQALVEGDEFVLYVRDSGSFVPRVERIRPWPDRGRGLSFMHALMDEVDVRPGPDGTELRIARRCP